jgi:predicted DNA-binding protein (MmcQ/YjbR family)
MIDVEYIRKMALSLEAVEEGPHFDKIAFRVKKKIFATIDLTKNKVVLKLSEIDQSVFVNYKPEIIYPVAGGWGRQGWTVFKMKQVRKDLFKDALVSAYCAVAPKKLAAKYQPDVR